MLIEKPKLLPEDLDMLCYACEDAPATHLCRYRVGDLSIQVCLCPKCMKIDTIRLLENTIGIQGISDQLPKEKVEAKEDLTTVPYHQASWSMLL